MLAKLMWHADANSYELYKEWLTLAYAKGSDAMGRLFGVIDEGFREFKQRDEPLTYSVGQYDVNKPKVEKIYVPRLEKIEACYREALASVKDKAPSLFRFSDEEYSKFVDRPEPRGLPPAWYYMRKINPLPPKTK